MDKRAVSFDPAAYRAWLDSEPNKYTAVPDLAVAWQRSDGQGGWLVEVVLDALHTDQQALTYGATVESLKVWATSSPEDGPDGGVVAEVTVDGVPLSLGHIPADELIPTSTDLLPGYEAAGLALTVLAHRATTAAEHFRRRAGLVGDLFGGWWGSMTGVEIEQALVTLRDVFNGSVAEDLSELQLRIADKVMGLWAAAHDPDIETVDAEIVD